MTHKSPLIPIVAGLLILAGCAGRPDNYLYHADVREARVALERAYKMQADSRLHFVQPQNHLETCRIPLEKAYADTPDKTVIWDGGCTGGYAHGLGRIIYRSETESFDRVVDADFRTVRRLLFAEFDYLGTLSCWQKSRMTASAPKSPVKRSTVNAKADWKA